MPSGPMKKWGVLPVFAFVLAIGLDLDFKGLSTRSEVDAGLGNVHLPPGISELPPGSRGETDTCESSHGAAPGVDFPGRIQQLFETSADPGKAEMDRLLMIREWAEVDPVSMTGWVAESLRGDDRVQAFRQAAVIWAAKDLEAAIRWAQSIQDEGEKSRILLDVGLEAARINPRRAVALALDLPPSGPRDELIVHAVRQWASLDPSSAGSWVSGLPASSLRQEAVSAIAVSLSAEDGRRAAGLVADAMVAGQEQVNASIHVVRNWGARNPEETLEWIGQFTDASVRRQALQVLLAAWSMQSSETMLSWLDSHSDSSLRGEALAAMDSLPKRSMESEESASEPQDP